jgi:hypothetical protein
MFNLHGAASSAAKMNRRPGVKSRRVPGDVSWEQLRREVGRAWEQLCQRKPVYRESCLDPIFHYPVRKERAA